MLFKRLFFLGCIAMIGVSCGFGENTPSLPELHVHYDKNDKATKESFYLIEKNYKKYEAGTLEAADFEEMIDRCEFLLLKGASKLMGEQKDSYSPKEIEIILTSGVLAESKNIQLWVERFVGIIHIILGSDQSRISFADIKEMFRRMRLTARHISNVSELQKKLNIPDASSDQHQYWEIKRDVFSEIMKAVEILLQDSKGRINIPLVKKVILNQQKYFHLESWNRYIDAAYLINRIIYNHSDQYIAKEDIGSVLKMTRDTFEKIFEIQVLYEEKMLDTPQFSAMFEKYNLLLDSFLEAFYKSEGEKVRASDLSRLLGMLNLASSEEEAGIFVNALVALKGYVFQNQDLDFTRTDVQKMHLLLLGARESAKKAEEDFSNHVNKTDFEKIKPLWKNPLQPNQANVNALTISEVKLSSMLLYFIDHLISVYDMNRDGKLVVSSELSGIVRSVQHLISGFKKLMGDGSSVESATALNPDVVGKIILVIGDKLLINSNRDDALDRFEILDMVSFGIENDRFLASLTMKPLSWEEWVESGQFQNYFSQLVRSFPSHKVLYNYVLFIVKMFDIDPAQIPTDNQLRMVCGFMRLVEHIFLKYDTDLNGVLSLAELTGMYPHFEPLVKEAFEYYKAKGGVSTSTATWSDTWNYYTTSWDDIRKNVFFYALTYGAFPSAMPPDPSTYTVSCKRSVIVRLFSERVKEFLKDE